MEAELTSFARGMRCDYDQFERPLLLLSLVRDGTNCDDPAMTRSDDSHLTMYVPSAAGVASLDPETGAFTFDPDELPDESMLQELARAGFKPEADASWSPPRDGELLLLVMPVRFHVADADRAAAEPEPAAEDVGADDVELDEPVVLTVASNYGVNGTTGATRARTSGVLYPYRGQRDGIPIYEPPTPSGAHRTGAPRMV